MLHLAWKYPEHNPNFSQNGRFIAVNKIVLYCLDGCRGNFRILKATSFGFLFYHKDFQPYQVLYKKRISKWNFFEKKCFTLKCHKNLIFLQNQGYLGFFYIGVKLPQNDHMFLPILHLFPSITYSSLNLKSPNDNFRKGSQNNGLYPHTFSTKVLNSVATRTAQICITVEIDLRIPHHDSCKYVHDMKQFGKFLTISNHRWQ